MNREIKFRAYLKGHWAEKEYGTMLYDYQNTILLESEGFTETDDFKIMQFTGLKDKNGKGKDTYFGDIAKDKHGQIFAIIDDYAFMAHLETIWFEIIGNIYENKELLQ